MVSNIFNNTEKRRWWKYEDLQNKPKTKAENRLVMRRNYADKFLDYCVLFFTKVYLSIRRFVMSAVFPLVILSISLWLSGYLAAERLAFWSLLSVVIGVVVSVSIIIVKESSNGRN